MQATEDMTKEERAEYWSMVVDEFHESELTKTAYCQKNEIPVSTLNYWENRLKEMKLAEEERGNRFVELSVPEGDSATIRFSSFNADDFVTEIALICDGVKVLVNSETPMSLLASVLGELGYAK